MSLATVTVRSRFLPPLSFELDPGSLLGGGDGGERSSGGIATAAKLSVSVGPVTYAPAGDPGDEWVMWVGGAVVLAVVILARIVR